MDGEHRSGGVPHHLGWIAVLVLRGDVLVGVRLLDVGAGAQALGVGEDAAQDVELLGPGQVVEGEQRLALEVREHRGGRVPDQIAQGQVEGAPMTVADRLEEMRLSGPHRSVDKEGVVPSSLSRRYRLGGQKLVVDITLLFTSTLHTFSV